MGTIRTILALSVLFDHAWPNAMIFVGGRNAVQMFYMISGFLMSYILVQRNAYQTTGAFYLSRYLRLYPVYIVVAILSLAWSLFSGWPDILAVYARVPSSAEIFLILSNIFIVGQDWIMFSGIEHHHLAFEADYTTSEVLLYEGLLVPQAWTLGLELSFYAIAPFVLRSRPLLLALLALSLAIRMMLAWLGVVTHDPWSYRFFPAELAFFLLGALAHQILYPAYQRFFVNKEWLTEWAWYVMLAVVLFYAVLPFGGAPKAMVLLAVFGLLLPFLFTFQNQYKWDNWIGNLSYPLYIGHMLILNIVIYFIQPVNVMEKRALAVLIAFLALGFAMVLNRLVAEPFETVRASLKAKQNDPAPLKSR